MSFKLNLLVLAIFLFGNNLAFAQVKMSKQNLDIITHEFPEEKLAIQKVLDGIFKSIQENDADKLISYHVYGPKFTEFRNGGPRFDAKDNEEYERGFANGAESFEYNLGDLQIDVFGEVAIVTFEADFRPTFGGTPVQIWANVTLVFVKTKGEWKITHEHFTEFQKE